MSLSFAGKLLRREYNVKFHQAKINPKSLITDISCLMVSSKMMKLPQSKVYQSFNNIVDVAMGGIINESEMKEQTEENSYSKQFDSLRYYQNQQKGRARDNYGLIRYEEEMGCVISYDDNDWIVSSFDTCSSSSESFSMQESERNESEYDDIFVIDSEVAESGDIFDEKVVEIGEFQSIKFVGEPVSRVHHLYTSKLRKSTWRKKYSLCES